MSQKLRIALVTETYFPQINGVSRTLDRLVGHLLAAGDEVHLLHPQYPDGVVEARAGFYPTAYRSVPLPFYREIMLPLVGAGTIRRKLEEISPDVVHIATEGSLGLSALRACRRLKLPTVSSYHTNFSHYLESYRLGPVRGLVWRYLRWFHNATRATLCPAPSIRDLLVERGFANVAVWGRGVDSELFNPLKRDEELRKDLGFKKHDLVFVYCGRLAAEKNLMMLWDAFRKLNSPRARLLVIGDGPLRERLEAESDPRAVFVGYQKGEALARHYAAADIMAFPSLTETFGNVMLEAMSSGLPVVAYRVTGPKDVVIHEQTGELVDRIDGHSLATAMARFLEDDTRRLCSGIQARRHAEQQSWPEINNTVRRAYLQAVGPVDEKTEKGRVYAPDSA